MTTQSTYPEQSIPSIATGLPCAFRVSVCDDDTACVMLPHPPHPAGWQADIDPCWLDWPSEAVHAAWAKAHHRMTLAGYVAGDDSGSDEICAYIWYVRA